MCEASEAENSDSTIWKAKEDHWPLFYVEVLEIWEIRNRRTAKPRERKAVVVGEGRPRKQIQSSLSVNGCYVGLGGVRIHLGK